MPVIDEKGRVFGLINVVDLLAILVVLAFAIGLASLWVGGVSLGDDAQNVTVVVEATERPFVGDALAEESARTCQRGATVDHVEVRDRFTPENATTTHERLWITASVDAAQRDGVWHHGDQAVVVGGELSLDLCTVRVVGTVVDVREGG